jgi:cholesterol oxidase
VAIFDAIVIGSGFGGAVTACRLAEAGYRVLVLERGRRWSQKDLPRAPGDSWIWDQYRPEKRNGWLDLRIWPNMIVAQGAAVGGGSLIYANVSVDGKPDTFEKGWPPEITYSKLKPYYDAVGRMLNVQKLPANQLTARLKLLKEGAEKLGHGDKFEQLDLAVTFDPAWNYEQPDPFNPAKSKKFINAFGREQGTCVHLGNCDIGCDVGAKNTLDLNYLAQAENRGAEVRALHLVRAVSPEAGPAQGGYRVHFDRLTGGRRDPGSESARIVVISAGSLGSTELLLRCRDERRTLPDVSRRLGRNWSSNGDFLTLAVHSGRAVRPTRGPTISGAVDFLGPRALDGKHMFIEDGGFPDLLRTWVDERRGGPRSRLRRALLARACARRRKGGPAVGGNNAVVRAITRRRRWRASSAPPVGRFRQDEAAPGLGRAGVGAHGQRGRGHAPQDGRGNGRQAARPTDMEAVEGPGDSAPAWWLQHGGVGCQRGG